MTMQIPRSTLRNRQSTLRITNPHWRQLEARFLGKIDDIAKRYFPYRPTPASIVLSLRPPKWLLNSTSSCCCLHGVSMQIFRPHTSAKRVRQSAPNEHAKFVVYANSVMK